MPKKKSKAARAAYLTAAATTQFTDAVSSLNEANALLDEAAEEARADAAGFVLAAESKQREADDAVNAQRKNNRVIERLEALIA